jgi:cellobiose phosphorylase
VPSRDLIHRNGLGGFTRDGREYVIGLLAGQSTPAPWVNVIANPWFGTVISESGSAYTWATNSHEYRLTPWSNDPVSDPSGEAIYIRDEETGVFRSPSPQPSPGATPYTTRHGFGYTVFEHAEQGLLTELTVYVATDAPVKLSVCRVRNLSSRPRRISVTGYCEWVLGELRSRSLLHVQTEVDPETGALLARNRFHSDFPEMIAFMDADPAQSVSGDRMEFLGRCGSPARPAALQRSRLSGRTGAGLDPAGAVQIVIELPPGQEREVSLRVGAAGSIGEVRALVTRFRGSGAAKSALERVWSYWGRTLGIVNVDTPDSSVNVLVNGWLPYQTLCCRLWARTGFYQSGGAFGFRDQLQDVMALVHAEPGLVREHLLRSAGRQYPEGDVQHWWHPPTGRGVRTRTSDDFLWLPYAACRYSDCTGDTGVWEENIPFIEGRALRDDEESYYDLPSASRQSATLYDHCARAVRHGLRLGAHGLPLMGSGDWNDGMNLVGIHGKGESVWLAFFLCDVLRKFGPVAASRGDADFAETCRKSEVEIRAAADATAWDGAWYRRAYFDDGSPLGSAGNPECQIDSIPQSWSVLSGGHTDRQATAMASVLGKLVRPQSGIIQLFDPPFDKSDMNPGYIRGYIPGVRENGGQYTHAAVWAVMAFAERGEADRAWELFQMLNPVRHGGDAASVSRYMAEPYVVAADVYALPKQPGRGGWTWYTGSAGWMYRLLVESLIGVVLRGGSQLCIEPRLPRAWDSLKVHYRYRSSLYHITLVRRVGAAPGAVLDGNLVDPAALPLRDDGAEHWATIPFG